jgi:hypothetical protein
VDLTRTATRAQYHRALETWRWLDIERKVPLFTSLFGDVFLESYDGCWWLDTVRGTLIRPWESVDAMDTDLDTARGQKAFLRSRLALDAELSGLVPGDDEIYGFTVAPIVGGAVDVANLEVMELTLRLHLSGQLHGHVRGRSRTPD